MSRFLSVALAVLVTSSSAMAQTSGNTSSTAPEHPAAPLDPKVDQEIQRQMAQAKGELDAQMRAEAQTAQATAEFVGPQEEGRRTEPLEVHGYFRMRGDLFDHFDLSRPPDPAGYFAFPRPLINRHTITTGNMRLRLEPTLNVSDNIRVRTQVDALDNLVLGSTPEGLFQNVNARAPLAFLSPGQVPPEAGVNSDRASIRVKRAYAEVQTPPGLLSFGRMGSDWGLGILSHAGNGIDDDFGDTVDRLQFAISIPRTPVGSVTLIPMFTWISSGVISQDPAVIGGIGQPFDRDPSDDAKAIGIQILHQESAQQRESRFAAGLPSISYGLWYNYRSQTYDFSKYDYSTTVPPAGQPIDPNDPNQPHDYPAGQPTRRDASAHVLDLWSRFETRRLRIELELVGVYGQIGNASFPGDSATGPVLLRQFGGAIQSTYEAVENKLTLGGEFGIASGDRDPGFGNFPGRSCGTSPCTFKYGDIEGPQFLSGDKVLDVRNFSFNRAYRVDLIFWREIVGGVTDAFYLKPSLRWSILRRLRFDAAIIYSQAMYAESTPSSTGPGTGKAPLGIELDTGLRFDADPFIAFLNYGIFQPLGAFDSPGQGVGTLARAQALRAGLLLKF